MHQAEKGSRHSGKNDTSYPAGTSHSYGGIATFAEPPAKHTIY